MEHNLYQTTHIYTSACCEAYRKAHCDYSLLYINIVKKQKILNIIRKTPNFFVIREESQYIYGEISKYCHFLTHLKEWVSVV